MKLIRTIIFIMFFMGSMLAFSNTLVIGVAKFIPPYSFLGTEHHYYGFSIDLLNEICKRINATCQYKAIPVEKQLALLDSGDLDVTLSPRPIPQTKSEKYIYSIPYLASEGEFVTLNPDIKSMADLKDKKIGVYKPSHLDTVVLSFTNKDNITEYNKLPDALVGLKSNDVDVLLLNVNVSKYYVNNVINLHVVGHPISLGNGYGVVTLLKNADLINTINKAILQMENDGTYVAIYSQYFGT